MADRQKDDRQAQGGQAARVSWTADQQAVIDSRDQNLLVSAAAGSGKTAVLVERILDRVTDRKKPLDIDRLLVVTFTRAAAGEMKERLGRALEKRLEADPMNAHLQRQGVLLHHAQISTIHGFCTYVIQNYFHRIDLDPGYRIGDEGELRLLRGRVMRELLEEEYERAGQEGEASPFYGLAEAYASGKSDAKLEGLIDRVFDFAASDPDPEAWLKACVRGFRVESEEELNGTAWMQSLLEDCKRMAEGAVDLAGRNLALAGRPDGPACYLPMMESDLELAENLAGCSSYSAFAEAFAGLSYKRLSGKKAGPGEDADIREEIKANREILKEILDKKLRPYFDRPVEDVLGEFAILYPHCRELVRLVLAFGDRFSEAKRKKNLLDYADLEHFALSILLDRDERGDLVRSDAARELAARFDEVMIDEYQDSNLVQEALLSAVSGCEEGRWNRFMVGDMKQAIYGFRMARPDLFLDKYLTYVADPHARERRIDLSRNFRSRREVLDTSNALFGRLMAPDLGGIAYDDAAALHAGASYPEAEGEDYRTELILLNKSDLEESGREAVIEAQALVIARRIRALRETLIYDKDRGEMRPVCYRDCVVLLRSGSDWANIFVRVLKEEGIPAHTASRTGYFTATEIRLLLNLLRVIDNPMQDIPLAAVLRSPLVGLADSDLAGIRAEFPEGQLFESVCSFADPAGRAMEEERSGEQEVPGRRDEDDRTSRLLSGRDLALDKVRLFLSRLELFRLHARERAVSELIREALEVTRYDVFAAGMPGGEQRAANIRMLEEKAAAFEASSMQGLFSFIRYIEQLEKYEVDFGEVNLFGEGEDTVRIMTIHKSKGLEFPVVFLAGLDKSFNRQDSSSPVVLHAMLGMGMDVVDPVLRVKWKPLIKRAVTRSITKDNLAEELRVLYVALTRARDKLILVGAVEKEEEIEAARTAALGEGEGILPYYERLGAGSYWKWISRALCRETGIRVRGVAAADLLASEIKQELETASLIRKLERPDTTVIGSEVYAFLEQKQGFRYPGEGLSLLPAKLSVSDLKTMSREEEDRERAGVLELFRGEDMGGESAGYRPAASGDSGGAGDGSGFGEAACDLLPDFLREEEERAPAAARGTAYHRFFECMDYRRAEAVSREKGQDGDILRQALLSDLELQRRDMTERGKLTDREAAALDLEDFVTFLLSDLGRRMMRSDSLGRLRREQPFFLQLLSQEVREDWPENEPVLVQGIIDAYFEEEGELVLVDYKTDRLPGGDGQVLVDRYQTQLDYYQRALERLTGLSVKEKCIYSVTIGDTLCLS